MTKSTIEKRWDRDKRAKQLTIFSREGEKNFLVRLFRDNFDTAGHLGSDENGHTLRFF
jgi:hypothetical protein